MSDAQSTESKTSQESLISPGVEPGTLIWILVLAIPALLLFLLLEKQQPFF